MHRLRVPARRRFAVLFGATMIVSTGLFVQVASAAPPSSFVDVNNHQERWSGTGSWDWANGANSNPANCTHPTTVGGVQTCPGTNGLFDGGIYNGATVPPTAPGYIGPTTGVPAGARDFIVDPLSVDHTTCAFPPTAGGSATAITGDPTVYTGAGSETNGDLLTADTWGNGSTPNKDEINNVFAIGHRVESGGVVTVNEIFFGGERVVNNGDSHIDFEFLQNTVSLVPNSTGCAGTFSGDRAQGDMLLSVDFTSGGTFGDDILYQWHCAKEGDTQPATGTICNPPNHGKSVPHYQQVSDASATFGVNSQGPVDCGGWVCRNADGSLNTKVGTNELMEGGINLKDLGFTGCLSSFLPHTRSAQSFTSVLKDFALANFNTCSPTTSMTVSPSASQLVHKGDSVNFTFSEQNDGNVALTSPSVSVSFSPSGPTGCATTTLVASSDTNGNGILDPGETFQFTCTATFPTDGVFTVTGTGHGTFNGNDITYPGDPEERTQTTVRVITPATTLSKQASASQVHIGDTVTYTYTETNGTTGGNVADRAISGVGVADDKCSPVAGVDTTPADGFNDGDTNLNNKLDATETWTFTCTSAALNTAGTVTNTAIATGTDALGTTITYCTDPASPPAGTICSQTERAQASVQVINPNTTLTKLVSATVNATYTFREQNTGDVALSNPSVSDSNANCTPAQSLKPSPNATRNIGDDDNDGVFDPNETWTWTCTVAALLTVDTDGTTSLIPLTATTQNTATGHGTDPLLRDITAPAYPNEQDKTTVTITVSHP
jgi:hypothetical protein